MEKLNKNMLTEENDAISAKLDSVFNREKELMFYKEIVANKAKSTNFNPSAFSFTPRLIFSILGVVSILFLGIVLIATKTVNMNLKIDKINIFSEDVKDSSSSTTSTNENTFASVAKKEVLKHTDKVKVKDKLVKSNEFDENQTDDTNKVIDDETNYSNANLGKQSGKEVELKIIDGYHVAPRETVISSGIMLVENADISVLKFKLSEILTEFKLKNIIKSDDVLNITSNKYVGELKNGQMVLFNIQFKIFKENPSKLQLMLRYNQIPNTNEINKSEAINIDKLFYRDLKQDITQKLVKFLK